MKIVSPDHLWDQQLCDGTNPHIWMVKTGRFPTKKGGPGTNPQSRLEAGSGKPEAGSYFLRVI